MTIIGDGKRYSEEIFELESDFEEDIIKNSKNLFGNKIVFINPKKKIVGKFLGGTIPDGFFFDFNDPNDPQFYLVEVELISHSFYNHVFPQITKFFAFYKNAKLHKDLVEKLFVLIDKDQELLTSFKMFLGRKEVYKFLSDVIDSSQNILLITNGSFKEIPEIMETYTDTWGKIVKCLEIKKYVNNKNVIYTITPDFENIQYIETELETVDEESENGQFSEEHHLDDVTDQTKSIYQAIKDITLAGNRKFIFNPQKYYISIKGDKNIAFLKITKKKVRIIPLLPVVKIREIVKNYPIVELSTGVQDFYNGECAAITIDNLKHVDEIESLINSTIENNRKH